MPEPKNVKVRFLAATKYETVPPVHYKAGQVVELREDLAERWIKRGAAVAVDGEQGGKGEQAPARKLPEGVPADWETYNAEDTRALAVKLGAKADDVTTKRLAVEFIEGKIAAESDGQQ